MTYALLHNLTLIDGTGRKPVADAAVLVDDDRIVAAGPRSRIKQPNAPVRMLDAGGQWLMPGLIDTHVHMMFEGVNIGRDLAKPFSMRFYEAPVFMRRTLDAGITTVRDAGGTDFGTKMAIEQGLITGPRMQVSITALSITGGHGDGWMRSGGEFKIMHEYPGMPGNLMDGVEGVTRKVREVLRAGAEVVKICATGGVLSPTDHPEFIQFNEAELRAIVTEAENRKGIKVMAHAQGVEGIKLAVRCGIHSIEHSIYLDDEAMALMIEKGTFLVPTLLAPVAVLEIGEAGGMPAYGVAKARETVEIHADSITRAYKAGVKIAMGTDAAVMPHGTNLRELGLMETIGMKPMDILVATTRTAAECLGWQDRIGTVEAGKLADLVITRVDPLTHIRHLADPGNIAHVMKGGAWVKGGLK